MRCKDDPLYIKLNSIRNNRVLWWGYGIFKLIDRLKNLALAQQAGNLYWKEQRIWNQKTKIQVVVFSADEWYNCWSNNLFLSQLFHLSMEYAITISYSYYGVVMLGKKVGNESYYYIYYGLYMWSFLSVSIIPLSFLERARELFPEHQESWWVLSLLPITRLKPSGELCRIVLVDCNSLIEGVLFNFTFLKSISYLLKFLIQLLCYFPIFLFATFQWPVHISVSLSLFASVVISKWNILHRMPQIQKEGHAHSITNIALNCQTSDRVWWDYFQLP